MPSEHEKLKEHIEQLGNVWENYKETNEQRLKEIEEKGAVSAETQEKLDRIDASVQKQEEYRQAIEKQLAEIEKRAEQLEIEMQRPDQKDAVKEKSECPTFDLYLRKGENYKSNLRQELEQELAKAWAPLYDGDMEKALSVIGDPQGGYRVPPTRARTMVERLFESSPIRQVALVQSIGTDRYEEPVDDDEISSGGFVGEKASRSTTDTQTFSELVIPIHEQYAMPATTQKMLDDAAFNVEEYIQRKLEEKMSRVENARAVTGDGVHTLRGFTTYANGTTYDTVEQVTGNGATGKLHPNDFLDLQYSLHPTYMARATWVMNKLTVKEARKMQDGEGQYIWQPGLQQNVPNQILGSSYVMFHDMATVDSGNIAVAYADWREFYTIIDRMDVRVLRDPYTNKPNILFYTTKRLGGGVRQGRAGKLLVIPSS